MKRRNLHLTEKQEKALNKLKEKTGTPVAALIRRAIDRYIKGQKK